jgi:uncharacterized protein YyaL (SSP411 family)
MPSSALVNRLHNHPSPYLALHGEDPVAWQEWNAGALALARRYNRLLFVSIGYFSFHWCHVMQRESYRDPEIARVLNANFIPVKVDREINGALDAEMQTFAERTAGRAGWPLNVFVTPEGYPLFAMLYSPPREFLRIVTQLNERWLKEADRLKEMARGAAVPKRVSKPAAARFSPLVGERYRAQLVREALAQADMFRGGFGSVAKFPMAPQLTALVEILRQEPQPRLAEFLQLTLDHMASQGLYDHVGGGFFRYTTDPDWHIPHFEKMLYDNAQLAVVYLRAAETFNLPRYRETAFATLDFMLAEMRDPATGAFIASTSAIDAQNREGGVYLWSKEDLRRLLTPDEYALAVRIWGLDAPAEFDLGYLPMHKIAPSEEEWARLAAIHAKLRKVRGQRPLPKDHKLLAALNGLALQAFSEAARVDKRYAVPALGIRDFLANKLVRGQELRKGISAGKDLGAAELEDYASVAAGLLSHSGVSGEREDRELAAKVARQGWARFHQESGWTLQQTSLLATTASEAMVSDGALPSPSSVLIRASWRLGGKDLRAKALSALNTGYAELDRGVFWFASQVAAMTALKEPERD